MMKVVLGGVALVGGLYAALMGIAVGSAVVETAQFAQRTGRARCEFAAHIP